MGHALFAYGTLESSDVLEAVAGRSFPGEPARLPDFACFRVRGADYPAIVERVGAVTAGTLYRGIGARELARIDAYEGELYERRAVTLRLATGDTAAAEAYVLRPEALSHLGDEPWDRAAFGAGANDDYSM